MRRFVGDAVRAFITLSLGVLAAAGVVAVGSASIGQAPDANGPAPGVRSQAHDQGAPAQRTVVTPPWGGESRLPSPHSFDPALMREDAEIGLYTHDMGTAGLQAVDTDGDGLSEIVVAQWATWYLLELVPGSGGLRPRYVVQRSRVSTPDTKTIIDVRVGDIDGDAKLEVVVLHSEGTIAFHDAATGSLTSTFNTTVSNHDDFEVEDVDGLPGDEIVELDDAGLRVFQHGSSTPSWTVTGVSGTDLAIGNVDADAAKELVLGSESGSRVIDCQSHAIEWTYSSGFGSFVDVADVDGDGLEEIAGCDTWNRCQVVDGDTRLEKWHDITFTSQERGAIRCRDIDGDGIAELGVGDAGWGEVSFYDGITGARVGDVANPLNGVANLDFADVDGDCEGEVIWAAGHWTANRADQIHVASLSTSAIEWTDFPIVAPTHAFAVADIDADGTSEVVRACTDSKYLYQLGVYVTNMTTRQEERIPAVRDLVYLANPNDEPGLVVVQADADPQLEYVIVGNEDLFDAQVSAYDGISHERQWVSPAWSAEGVRAMTVADCDGDGTAELLVSTQEWAAGVSPRLRSLRITDGSEIYVSPPGCTTCFAGVDSIRVADVDADGDNDIVAIIEWSGIHVGDARTHAETWSSHDSAVRALDVADLIRGGPLEILLGRYTGILRALDGASHDEIFSTYIGPGSISAIKVADIDGDGMSEILVGQQPPTVAATNPTHVLKVLAGHDRQLLWTSRPFDSAIGLDDSLCVADADDDGLMEIVFDDRSALHFLEYGGRSADGDPPLFDGVEGAQAVVTSSCCPAVDVSWNAATDLLTPPPQYEVHRSGTAPFTPSSSTLVTTTGQLSYRDTNVAMDTTYHYLVRALDGAGNEDANMRNASVTLPSDDVPVPPTGLLVTDPSSCDIGGVDVAWTPPTPPPGFAFDLEVDGVIVASDALSPLHHSMGDGASHAYRMQARNLACGYTAAGAPFDMADSGTTLEAPVVTSVNDATPCAREGVVVTFTHPGFAVSGRYDVERDGVVVLVDATSPAAVDAGDTLPHAWTVLAVDTDCPRRSESAAVTGEDTVRVLDPPIEVSVSDLDRCASSQLVLAFAHSGFPGTGHYELLRDGLVVLSPVTSGQSIAAPDNIAHDYSVKAIDEECDLSADSELRRGQDLTDCGLPAREVELRVSKDATLSDALSVRWTQAVGSVSRHDVYVGTLANLGVGVYDHVATRAGLSFPDAVDTTTGCGATDATTLEARVTGPGTGAYLLVVAVGTDGLPGSFGARSDGIDRHDPEVDPRPTTTFCP